MSCSMLCQNFIIFGGLIVILKQAFFLKTKQGFCDMVGTNLVSVSCNSIVVALSDLLSNIRHQNFRPSQSNDNADHVDPEQRYKWLDDFTALEVINLLTV